jgi:hypothetical protein
MIIGAPFGFLGGASNVPMAARAYTGSASPQSLDFGFRPDWLWIKEDSTASGRMFDSVGGDAPFNMNDPNARLSSVAGFALTEGGVELPANTANISATGQSYRAVAFRELAGVTGFNVVSWTGDGSGATSVGAGSHPDPKPSFVAARCSSTNLSASGGETPAFWAGEVTAWELGGSKQTTGFITGVDITPPTYSFDVSTALNVNLATYIAWIWGTSGQANVAVGTYSGNGSNQAIDVSASVPGNIGFLFIKRLASTAEGVWFDYTQGSGALTAAVKPFSAVANGSGYNVTLGTGSFTLGDADVEYNAAGSTYGYVAIKAP